MDVFSESRLSFCQLTRLSGDIIEVIPDGGVEIDLAMVEELDANLVAMMGTSFAMLVNKVNSYSVTFDAQMKIGLMPSVAATAVVVYNSAGEMGTQQIKAMTEEEGEEKSINIFFDRNQAVSWLEEKMAALP